MIKKSGTTLNKMIARKLGVIDQLPIPNYSTDIGAAMKIAHYFEYKYNLKGYFLQIGYYNDAYRVSFKCNSIDDVEFIVFGAGVTIALALCDALIHEESFKE